MYSGYSVGSSFDLINDIINNISIILHCIIKFIYSYFNDIEYNSISFDIVTRYSKMKQDVVETYNNNIDKDSLLHKTIVYSIYCLEYLKSFVLGYRIEPFNNNWVSISFIDQSEYDKNIVSFTFDETYDEIDSIYFFKNNIDIDYCSDFKDWYNTAKTVLLKNRKVYDCLIAMRMNDKYIYKVCDIENESYEELPSEFSKVKFLSIEYQHPEIKNPIVIDIDKNAYLIGNELLSCTFVKRSLEYTFNVKNFDTDYVLCIMDNNLNTFELKCNEFIILEKDTYKIVKKQNDDYVVLDKK